MNDKTRYLIIVSTLVTIVGVGTGLIAYYTELAGGPRSGRTAPDELRYVPRNAALVAYADIRQVMASGLHQKLQAAIPGREHESRQFAERTGIDVEKDIDRVVACLEAPIPTGGP